MEIIGNGFLANHFAPLRERYPGAVLFASGVSRSGCTDEAEFRREVDLLYATLERCRAQQHTLVYFSTSSDLMYGGPGSQGREDEPIFPRSAYGRHKVAMETVIERSGAPFLVLRLAYAVGPCQPPHQLIPALYDQVCQGSVRIRRGVRRDLIDIADVVAITEQLLARGVRNQVLNLASGVAVPVDEIAAYLAMRVDHPVAVTYIDGQAGYRVSTERLARALGSFASFGFDQYYYRRVIDRYWQHSA